ncbi:DUF2382 domain-containing protein [Hymenobacter sp. YC55]|uniref:YsnF/AvaK domain-containing protein n=1 Tax=Hymenobacter sp. YC55 TaxID=3034019 RepID=UPI0023F71513|nr:DUF2382 domain-containing protein [Hymenobacter sp. YC55]MDF7815403.1 DUF2382 domain-containing protein [Hymenobacter sp. YC55]
MHHSTDSLPTDLQPASARDATETPLVVPVIEEYAVVTRQLVETGRVRLSKKVLQHEETLTLSLQQDQVHVEHIPVNEYQVEGTPLPVSRQEGDTLIIPVLREVVVTRVLLVEEIHVTKRQVTVPHIESIVLRREEIQIERFVADEPPLA